MYTDGAAKTLETLIASSLQLQSTSHDAENGCEGKGFDILSCFFPRITGVLEFLGPDR